MNHKSNFRGLGIALGAVAGAIAGNMGVWLAVGVAIGLAIGMSSRRKTPDCPECAALHPAHQEAPREERSPQ